MTAPLCAAALFIQDEVNNYKPNQEVEGNRGWLLLGLTVLDTALSITALTLAILGTIQTIAMPAAAFGSLYGVSGLITLIWIPAAILLIAVTCNEKNNP